MYIHILHMHSVHQGALEATNKTPSHYSLKHWRKLLLLQYCRDCYYNRYNCCCHCIPPHIYTPLLPQPQQNFDNSNYSSYCSNNSTVTTADSAATYKPVQHIWAQSSQGQPAWLDRGWCEGSSWCLRKRPEGIIDPSQLSPPRSHIYTLGCDLWNYCYASEICFWGALSASQCAVKTGEKTQWNARESRHSLHASTKYSTTK